MASCVSDLPPCRLLSVRCFEARNHLLSGSSTTMPTAMHTRPLGRKLKNDRGSNPADTSTS